MEMARNLNESISRTRLNKYNIRFHHDGEQSGLSEYLLGR